MIFAIIVLGLSIHAANWQQIGSIPTTTAFCAFAGAFATLVAIVGIAAIWLTAIPNLVMSGLDTLTSIILLAGGIVSLPFNIETIYTTNTISRHTRRRSPVSTAELLSMTNTI
jgi:hypothetical protein